MNFEITILGSNSAVFNHGRHPTAQVVTIANRCFLVDCGEGTQERLHENINHRTDEMIRMGLVDEVNQLISYKHLNALQTVGYSEIFDYLEGKTSLSEAIELIKIHTRQYAKRQMTWFRKDKEIMWVNTVDDSYSFKDLLNKLENAI